MPFSITKEKAIELVHKKINSGLFIPKEIKNFSIDCIRGIYLPYWIINASYTNAAVIEGQVRSGKSTVTRYFGRAGKLKLTRFPIDASQALSDESSSRLEPFELSHLKPFDEDYLAGFYSNVSDVTYIDLKRATLKRAEEYFAKEAMDDVRASRKKIVSSIPSVKIENNMVYAMLPAWFITFKYKGKPNTILVNGDTGKVVCALPWNKGLFYSLLFTFGAVATTADYFVFRYTLPVFFAGRSSSSGSDSRGKLIALLVAGIIALFSVGIRKIIKVVKNIQLTQDKKMFNFTKKRQG